MSDICMCVHGAGQLVVNPQIRNAFGLSPLGLSSLTAQLIVVKKSLTDKTWHKGGYFLTERADTNCLTRDAHSAAREAAQDIKVNKTKLVIWKERPFFVRNDFIDSEGPNNFGKTELHYLMGMFGLTTRFNDHNDTTLEMVHAKLDEAIAWAKDNGI